MPSTTVPVSRMNAVIPVALVANQSGLLAVATAALVTFARPQEPPLVATPLPDDEEMPDEGEIPGEEPPTELPDDPPEDDVPPRFSCGRTVLRCANFAPMTVATAAESKPTRQVIFLTRLSPASRARAAFTYSFGVTPLRSSRGSSANRPNSF
jgi:hypothetical protein